jgi:hypothetical protein
MKGELKKLALETLRQKGKNGKNQKRMKNAVN